jgi:hypothetical protein
MPDDTWFDEAMSNEQQEPQEITCRHCNQDGCYWQETWDGQGRARPRLYEDGKPHVCRPSADDFEVVG